MEPLKEFEIFEWMAYEKSSWSYVEKSLVYLKNKGVEVCLIIILVSDSS